MRTLLLLALLGSSAAAAPPKLKAGEDARLKHIVDRAPAWAADCLLDFNRVTIGSKGFMLDVECKDFEELMFSRETTPGSAEKLAGGLALFYKDSKLEPIAVTTSRGKTEGVAIVKTDGQAYGVLVQRREGKLIESYLCLDKKPARDRIAICRVAIDALARSTVAERGEAGFPVAPDE